jgi:signal transduction histidine kinase
MDFGVSKGSTTERDLSHESGKLERMLAQTVERVRLSLEGHVPSDAVMRVVSEEAGKLLEAIRKCEEEASKAQVAARLAERRKDEFLAMLGHELRNPLAPIVTALQLVKLKGEEESWEWERTVIERQVSHLVRLVDDLLDVSRITRGKLALNKKVVELAPIVNSAIEMVSPIFEERAHRLMVSVPALGMRLNVDPERLTQVLSNLLSNAANYTDAGGLIEITADRENGDVAIRVKDNGLGIVSDILPRIFDLFTQSERAIDRRQGGLGIGLAIVKNLVALHGGRVEAHSEGLGQGSTFTVYLPLAPAGETVARGRRNELARVARVAAEDGHKVLIVDDNRDAADILAVARSYGSRCRRWPESARGPKTLHSRCRIFRHWFARDGRLHASAQDETEARARPCASHCDYGLWTRIRSRAVTRCGF